MELSGTLAHAFRRSGRLANGCRSRWSCAGHRGARDARLAVVAPEHGATHQEQERDDCKFCGGDALLPAVAVIPGNDQDDREPDQEPQGRERLQHSRPVEGGGGVGKSLQQAPGARGVRDAPLHDLAAVQSCPEALGFHVAHRASAISIRAVSGWDRGTCHTSPASRGRTGSAAASRARRRTGCAVYVPEACPASAAWPPGSRG